MQTYKVSRYFPTVNRLGVLYALIISSFAHVAIFGLIGDRSINSYISLDNAFHQQRIYISLVNTEVPVEPIA